MMKENKCLQSSNSAIDFDATGPSRKIALEASQIANFMNSKSLNEQSCIEFIKNSLNTYSNNDRLDKHGLKNTNHRDQLSNSSVKNIELKSQIKFYEDLNSCRKSTPIQDFSDYSLFDGDNTIKNVIKKCIGEIGYFKSITKNSDGCNSPENQHKNYCKNNANNQNSNDIKQKSYRSQNETISAMKQYAQSVSYLNTFIRENSELRSNCSPIRSKFYQGNISMKNKSKSEPKFRLSLSPSIKKTDTAQNLTNNSYVMKSGSNLTSYFNAIANKHSLGQNVYYGIKMPTYNHYKMNHFYGNKPNQKKIRKEDFPQPKMQYTPRVERKYNFIGVEEVDPKKYAAEYGSELINTSKLASLEITKWAAKNYILPSNTRLVSKKHSNNKKYSPPNRNFA
jgi:hypothetical protein